MIKLTDRQARVYDAIRAAIASTGIPPSRKELASTLGMNPNGIQCHLETLEDKQVIKIHPGKARGIEVINHDH